MAIENIEQKLAQIVQKDKSKWMQDAKWRRENRNWLKKSAKIAVKVLMRLDELGWNQKTLAEKMGKTPQYISKLCKGHENLTLKNIAMLEEVLAISLSLDVPTVEQELRSSSTNITKIFESIMNDFFKKLLTESKENEKPYRTSVVMQLNTKATNTVKPEVEDFAMCA